MPIRVVIGEDDVLLREGIAGILELAGLEVVAQTSNADDFLRRAQAHRPDVAVVDIQMPPGNADDGLRAALELRDTRPETGVVVLSQFFEESYAVELIGDRPGGVGYLLKERVGDVSVFIDAVSRVAAGGTALDSEIIARMMGRRRASGPLDELSPRDLDVLREMAEGKSNRGIAEALFVTEAAVEKHVTAIFRKLEIQPTGTEHRRVLAVVRYLREADHSPQSGSAAATRVPPVAGLSTSSLPPSAAALSASPTSP
jgi:DNA-binding NarL/FixJ family response regulator